MQLLYRLLPVIFIRHICCYSAPVEKQEYCYEHVCLSVCMRISGTARPKSPNFMSM